MFRPAIVFLALGALGAACSSEDSSGQSTITGANTTGSTASTTSSPSTTGNPPPTTGPASTAIPAVTPFTTVVPPPSSERSPYAATISAIDDEARARMTYSWRPGCPVGLEDLRLLTLPHWNADRQSVTGELVVHADAADAMVEVFRRLYEQRFPITRMELVDVYEADDQASMRANNTSAFNCREIDGRPGTWSQHSYGRAVDVNPLVNPWVRGSQVDPPEAAPYADRSVAVPGGIYAGDDVVAAFAALGWEWGGNWSTSKDYQHFSANGK